MTCALREPDDLGPYGFPVVGQRQELYTQGCSRRIRLVSPKSGKWILGAECPFEALQVLFRCMSVEGDQKIIGGWIVVMQQRGGHPCALGNPSYADGRITFLQHDLAGSLQNEKFGLRRVSSNAFGRPQVKALWIESLT